LLFDWTIDAKMNEPELIVRNMRREELDVLVGWAIDEGWNPGLNDAEIFWATDPNGFIAAELKGKMIGGGSIFSYDGLYGFMGFFIIHPDHRSQGLGNTLWQARLKKLIKRLQAPAVIGMDGVFDMQAYYAKGGFEFSARDLRYESIGRPCPDRDGVVELSTVPFEQIEAYDRAHFPAPRTEFLRRWLAQPGAHALGAISEGDLTGFGVLRPCQNGCKIGPLFADNPTIAENLFLALSSRVPGKSIFLDVPENNQAAVAMALRHNMEEVFGCAKMYFGPKPVLPDHEIFAVTTFELG
jgi:ribosomal protein S18 acetylase RimI-like enzyme